MIPEEDPRFKNLERKIGIFMATALAGMVIAALLFGLQKDFFTKKYSLMFTVDRGTGFTKGMPVKLSGFRVGRVTAISLNNQAMVDISIEIDSDYRTWIRSDSTAKLVKEGLIGDSIIDISVGSPAKPELKDRDSITYVKTKALDEMADEIAQKIKPVLIEVRDIISYINDPDGDLKKTIRNAEQLTRNLEGTRQNTDSLIITANEKVQLVSARTASLLDSTRSKIDSIDLNPAISRINNSLELIDTKMPLLLDKAGSTLDNVSRISYETRLLSERVFPKIPGVLSQAEDLMFSTERLVNSLQNTWLLRDTATPAGKLIFINGDSHE
jgi:phospholipid/cholesterol/gamma-HCH transport system substrate-binding protein